MNILLVGSSGFIGSHLGVRLSSFVHVIPCGRKNLEDCTPFAIADYRITNSEEWQKILIHHNIDVVINSVGIIRETPQQKFRELHEIGPIELFKACAAASQVSKQIRIIQISALGADEKSTSQYHKSKKAADDFLWQLSLPKVIIYPSLVFGKNGESAKLFESIASLPFLVVPNHGRQQIQPIYIDDLAHLVASLIHTFPIQPLRILAVGSAPLTLNEFLQFLRKALNLPRALSLSIPYFIMKRIARWGNSIEHIPLNTEMLTMLEAGSTENSMSVWDQKTREVTPYENFIRQEDSWARLWQARFRWFVPTARACVALVWLVTGLVSLGIYPVKDSLQILKQAGLSGGYAMSSLVFASILDLVLGATSLIPKLTIRRFSYLFQMVTMTTYMLIITIRLPEFWLHPFGPLLKNLPLFALTLFLYIYDSKMNIPKPKLKTDHDNLPPC